MHRKHISLDGLWQFQVASPASQSPKDVATWREINVPAPWQAQFDDLRQHSGAAWYRRTFNLVDMPAGVAALRFGAVDYVAEGWLNGRYLGQHEGGYLPFAWEVTEYLQPGENELWVKVQDPNADRDRWPAWPFTEIPHGKQSWYGPISGIWQSVGLEMQPKVHMQHLRLTPDLDTRTLTFDCPLNVLSMPQGHGIEITVLNPDGQPVGAEHFATTQGSLSLDAVQPWSPDAPALYTVRATLLHDSEPVDRLESQCGFRTIEARAGRLYLNGESLYLRGVLDQAYYPETIYTPPSVEFLEDQLQKAKALGFNCVRCHIKIEDPRYYDVADRLGILIWTEIPNWIHLAPEVQQRAQRTLRQMVARDWNHPSIIAWTLINEDWGTDLVHNAEHRRWLAEFYAEAKALDPTRLVVDNSACHPNVHVATDIEDYHHYRVLPDHAYEWDVWVDDFAARPAWTWANDYIENRIADAPLIVSEFGNWGLPDPALIQEADVEPWWFETGLDWGEGIVYPHGFRARFHQWGLAEIFDDLSHFTRAHQTQMARSLAYEISSMRAASQIGGYVITELTDVHWECNGLLDMRRHVKHGLEQLTQLNQDQVVVLRPRRWSAQVGETISVDVQTMGIHGEGTTGHVTWRCGTEEGTVPAPGGIIDVAMPTENSGGLLTLQATWQTSDGKTLATNAVDLAWLAPRVAEMPLYVADAGLGDVLTTLGYRLVTDPAEATVRIHRTVTPEALLAVQRGAHLVLLAGEKAADQNSVPLPGGRLVSRAGTVWQGDWAQSFSWIKPRPPFADLPGGPLLGMPYVNVMPDYVLTGLPAWAFRAHSWAGLAVGWLHKPVSLLSRFRYGRGELVVSTFRLNTETIAKDAVAQALLDGMLRLLEAGG